MAEQKITQVMMDDRTIDASKEIAMVLSIANTLRGPYRAERYKDVIIPMIILRRLECALDVKDAKGKSSREKVLAELKKNPKAPDQVPLRQYPTFFYSLLISLMIPAASSPNICSCSLTCAGLTNVSSTAVSEKSPL